MAVVLDVAGELEAVAGPHVVGDLRPPRRAVEPRRTTLDEVRRPHEDIPHFHCDHLGHRTMLGQYLTDRGFVTGDLEPGWIEAERRGGLGWPPMRSGVHQHPPLVDADMFKRNPNGADST
ncbi:MAG: hypothetical protein M5U19_21850 [Microthrixaceae bacterium]|nr:hypothetical protein [Microthrixaceae bacterium]